MHSPPKNHPAIFLWFGNPLSLTLLTAFSAHRFPVCKTFMFCLQNMNVLQTKHCI